MNKTIFTIFSLFMVTVCFAQFKDYKDVNIDNLMDDLQFTNENSEDIELIWWVPTDYWQVVFAQDPYSSPEETEELIRLMEDYLIVMAVKGKIGMFGGVKYQSYEDLKSSFSIIYDNHLLELVPQENLDPDLINFISIFQPLLKNLIGPMGENMHLFTFQLKEKGKPVPIDPKSTKALQFKLGDFVKDVELPIGSLMEEKICPEDNKELSGKWNFCPIHGVKLVRKEKS